MPATADLLANALHVLGWAASVHRPGSSPRKELDARAARLSRDGVAFDAGTVGHESSKALYTLQAAALGFGDAANRLPASVGWDSGVAGMIARRCGDALKALHEDAVSFDEVRDALRGTWGDHDPGAAIRGLLAEVRQAELATASPATAPAH